VEGKITHNTHDAFQVEDPDLKPHHRESLKTHDLGGIRTYKTTFQCQKEIFIV
jgi:hypothetical protein